MKARKTVRKGFRKIVVAAMMLAIGMILPVFIGQIKEIGDTLLPMHLPGIILQFILAPLIVKKLKKEQCVKIK